MLLISAAIGLFDCYSPPPDTTDVPPCGFSESTRDVGVSSEDGTDAALASTCIAPRPTPRDVRGLAPLTMTWELPATVQPEQPLTPHACEDRPGLLSAPEGDAPKVSPTGRTLCEVHQLPFATAGGESGFYLADAETPSCDGETLRFTDDAAPPQGVAVHIRWVHKRKPEDDAGCR